MIINLRKTLAFTLAETLIVMGIIGVVSALTLPNLNASTGEKEKVAKVKKIYRDLNDAYGRARAVYGPFEEWFINDSTSTAQQTRFCERLTEFMKVSKKVNNTTYILADGMQISLEGISPTSNSFHIDVDIDGPTKGKNNYGVDIFSFGTYDNVDNAQWSTNSVNNSMDIKPYFGGFYDSGMMVSCGNYGGVCTRWVIDYDNMDYLKLDSNGKCPNGKALNALANPPVVSCN